MRVLLKLSAIVLVGVVIQWAIGPGMGTVDEAAFDCRVGIAVLRGVPIDDPSIIELANELLVRQYARDKARRIERMRHLEPEAVAAAL
jgi:hypothetical protein